MNSRETPRGPGLAMRWVEVTDHRGRSCMEMRWAIAQEPAVAAEPAAVAVGTPVTPHAA